MLKIISDGTASKTRIFDQETGVEITQSVKAIEWKLDAKDGRASVSLQLSALVEIEVQGRLVDLAKANRETGQPEALV